MIKGALFDMDGVLVDNSHMHIKAFDVLYDRFQVPEEERKNVLDYMGRGLAEVLACLLPERIVSEYGVDFLCKEKERVYREIYADTIKPIDGLPTLLENLKVHGVRCAVGSSGCLDNIHFVLDKCHIASYFEEIVSADMVTKCKPDPEIYCVAADRLGLDPVDCVVFEDALVGIESAHRAGADRVIALTTSFPLDEIRACHPDYIIDDFTELEDDMLFGALR